MEFVSDCLVLKIEEYHDDGTLDTMMYVLYDQRERTYIIRGKRNDSNPNPPSVPFSFNCELEDDLIDFINLLVCKKFKRNYVLYNCIDLPGYSSDITYESLDSSLTFQNELAGYNNERYTHKSLTTYLRLLRRVYNDY
jgi:hypothetical protein